MVEKGCFFSGISEKENLNFSTQSFIIETVHFKAAKKRINL